MRLLKTFSALAVLIGLAHAANAQTCTPKVPASSLIEAGKWQMSINPTLPPQQFVDDKGELQGLNVELAKEIARRICLEPVFVRMDFPPMIPGLRAGRFDTINTGLFWTEERSKMLFLVPYAQQAISVYTDPASQPEDREVRGSRRPYRRRRGGNLHRAQVARVQRRDGREGSQADRPAHLRDRHRDLGGAARRPARGGAQHQRDRQLRSSSRASPRSGSGTSPAPTSPSPSATSCWRRPWPMH